MELMGIKVCTCKSTNTRQAGDNFAPIYHQGGVEEMLWTYGIPVRSTWYSIMENKMTGWQGIKADSPSLATQIVFNLLITVNYERRCWLYAVALGSFWIYSTVAMSWTPFAVSRPCSHLEMNLKAILFSRNGSAKGNSNTSGDGRGGKRESAFGLCRERQPQVITSSACIGKMVLSQH